MRSAKAVVMLSCLAIGLYRLWVCFALGQCNCHGPMHTYSSGTTLPILAVITRCLLMMAVTFGSQTEFPRSVPLVDASQHNPQTEFPRSVPLVRRFWPWVISVMGWVYLPHLLVQAPTKTFSVKRCRNEFQRTFHANPTSYLRDSS